MTTVGVVLATDEAPGMAGNHGPGPRFVTLAPGIAAKAHVTAEQPPTNTLDGRVFVVVTRNGDAEPRLQGPGLDQNAPPFWGIQAKTRTRPLRVIARGRVPLVFLDRSKRRAAKRKNPWK
jgi:hypothetical protein